MKKKTCLAALSMILTFFGCVSAPSAQHEQGDAADLLFAAAWEGNVTEVTRLVEQGVDIDAQNTSGATALMIALEGGKLDVTRLLVEKRAGLEVKDTAGHTALMYASQYGHADMVELMLQKGANIGATDKTEATALFFASAFGRPEAARVLIEKGADVNARNDQGGTALMAAAQEGHRHVVELLLERGADACAATKAGCTAIMLAAQRRHTGVVDLLRQRCDLAKPPAADGELRIPAGVRYIAGTEAANAKARERVWDLFYRTDSGALLPKAVACGPFLWEELVGTMGFDAAAGIPMQFTIPSKSGDLKLEGRGIRWEDKTSELQNLLRMVFRANGDFAVRKLTTDEMSIYWAFISWDIEEPVFVVESPGFRMVVDVTGDDVFFIDNYYRLFH